MASVSSCLRSLVCGGCFDVNIAQYVTARRSRFSQRMI